MLTTQRLSCWRTMRVVAFGFGGVAPEKQKASTRASSVALWARENEQKAACPRKMMLSL